MKRFYALAVLMLLGSPATAGDSFSFVIGGHHIHIERSGHCNSASCVSVSIPGIYEKRARRDRYDDDRDAPPLAPVTASVAPPVSAASKPGAARCLRASGRAGASGRAANRQQRRNRKSRRRPFNRSRPQPYRRRPPARVTAAAPPPPPPPAIARPAEAALPPMPAAARRRESPKWCTGLNKSPIVRSATGRPKDIRDWCGSSPAVRRCAAMCSIPSTNAKGETVLIDMKSKAASEWSGNIYSRDSGNTYYATMALKGPNSLQVEACALGGSSAPAMPGAGFPRPSDWPATVSCRRQP